jgi:hypothetical protein
MPVSLERVRNLSLTATFALLPILVAVVILGAVNDARPPWDALYVVVAALLLASGTVFTVTAVALGMRHTRQAAAAGARSRRRVTPAITVILLVALAANVVVIGLSGHVDVLNVLLALLVGALLLLLREHARREGIRDRSR